MMCPTPDNIGERVDVDDKEMAVDVGDGRIEE
jgi:hypothetical protein